MKQLAQTLQLPWNNGTTTVDGSLDNPALGNVGGILSTAMQFIFIFAGVGLLLMLLAGGFTFLTSAGDSKKLDKGKQQLTNAILGFIIIFAAYWMVQLLGYVFGFDAIGAIFV